MLELTIALAIFAIISLFGSAPVRLKPLYKHPSHKPRQYEIVSKETWDKHDRPYLGPKRKRTAEFYLSRFVSKKVKKLPKSLPF